MRYRQHGGSALAQRGGGLLDQARGGARDWMRRGIAVKARQAVAVADRLSERGTGHPSADETLWGLQDVLSRGLAGRRLGLI